MRKVIYLYLLDEGKADRLKGHWVRIFLCDRELLIDVDVA